jgi:hypothetical protein
MGPELTTTRAERKQHVERMLTSFRLEGIEPAIEDKMLLQFYIDGTISLDDLLAHARQFAAAAAYER